MTKKQTIKALYIIFFILILFATAVSGLEWIVGMIVTFGSGYILWKLTR